MNPISRISASPAVQSALQTLSQLVEPTLELTIAIQQIAAPTFAEGKRAAFVQQQFTAVGLDSVFQDELGNVYGRYASAAANEPAVVISAHTDTVFPAETDLTVRRDGRLIYGPGIGDNSLGVGGIIMVAKLLVETRFALPADVWFVANVAEEGLGDLKGMRAVVDRFGGEPTYLVVEGGLFGQISQQGIGARRFKLTVETPGGHSWGNFGARSAIHELARIIVDISQLMTPQSPKTTYNVGVIEGGNSINSIAQSASALLDLRSESPELLEGLVTAVRKIVARAHSLNDVTVKMELIGDRPAGSLASESPLGRWAQAALQEVGHFTPRFIASSTDANIPLSKGYTAVCIGLADSYNTHRLDEYVDPQNLPRGLAQLLLLTLAAAKY